MKSMFKLATLLTSLIWAGYAYSQAAPISGQVINQYGQPLPYAQVRICSVTSTGTPCTPTATVYQDYGLTTPLSQPISADQYGNYLVYVPQIASPNLYIVQFSPTSGVTWSYVVNGPFQPLGSGCSSGNTIANGCTGATTAAGIWANITGGTQTGSGSSQVNTLPGTLKSLLGQFIDPLTVANIPQLTVQSTLGGDTGGIGIYDTSDIGVSGGKSKVWFRIIRGMSATDGGPDLLTNLNSDSTGTELIADDLTRPMYDIEYGSSGYRIWTPAYPQASNPITVNDTYDVGYLQTSSATIGAVLGVAGEAVVHLKTVTSIGGYIPDSTIISRLPLTNGYTTIFNTATLFSQPIASQASETNTICPGTYAGVFNFAGTSNEWCLRTDTGGNFNLDGSRSTPLNIMSANTATGAVLFANTVSLQGSSTGLGSSFYELKDYSGNAASRNIRISNSYINPPGYGTLQISFGAAGGGAYGSTPDFQLNPGQFKLTGDSDVGATVPSIILNDTGTGSGVANWEIQSGLHTGGVITYTLNGTTTEFSFYPNGNFGPAGYLTPGTGYKSVDRTTGATVTTCTGFKNGLCISGT